MGEYLGMFAAGGLAITLFLGGYEPLFVFLSWVPSWVWFFGKLLALLALFIWLRGTLPRLRQDQLMRFAWTWMLPMTLVNMVVAAVWKYSASWDVPGAFLWRWVVCGAMVIGPGLWLSHAWRRRVKPRVYRYA